MLETELPYFSAEWSFQLNFSDLHLNISRLMTLVILTRAEYCTSNYCSHDTNHQFLSIFELSHKDDNNS